MSFLQNVKDQIDQISPSGFYVALRVGFSFPEAEENHLPEPWVDYYTAEGFVVDDPSMRWVYRNSGAIRSSMIDLPDPRQVRAHARVFGLSYGAVISVSLRGDAGRRSYGLFFRDDRDFTDAELDALLQILSGLHSGRDEDPGLTNAEIEALRMQAEGLRLKQIAGLLNISESAVKARLNNAKRKLGAKTLSQASSLAAQRRLI
jgi:DNA-binding CsgD family transcriptional regulator